MAFEHQPGMAIECLSIPIKLTKEPGLDNEGREVLKCGFKIGGGIDQDFRKSPQGYKDSGIYVTEVYENSPAAKCGLKIHDKILQLFVTFIMASGKQNIDYAEAAGNSSSSSSENDDMEEHNFPNTLEGFGYKFNEAGQLRSIEDDSPFEFVVRDEYYNQKRYEALGDVVTEHVYGLLVNEGNLKKLNIPLDASKTEPTTFIFHSDGAFTTADKLIILIHGSGVVRAGQWARRLIINDCIDSGTQLPFIKKAQAMGYGVVVLNTNDNTRQQGQNNIKIRGSESPENHANYVWKNLIMKSPAKHIAIIAHSYGGVVTINMCIKFTPFCEDRVFAMAFTDSVHNLALQQTPHSLIPWLKQVARNWISSSLPIDTLVPTANKNEIERVSAGHTRHDMTSWSSFKSVFEFIDQKYKAIVKSDRGVDKEL